MQIEINTPIALDETVQKKLTAIVRKATDDKQYAVNFHTYRSFNELRFDVLAFDTAKNELPEIRETVLTALFEYFIKNSK